MSKKLEAYLSYLENTGIKTLPVDLSFELKGKDVQTSTNTKIASKPIKKETASREKRVNAPINSVQKTAIDKSTHIDFDLIRIDFNKFKNYKNADELSKVMKSCHKCPLSKLRQNVVVGEGSVTADLMFIGEGPGEREDKLGRPFVGKAGNLLTKIIEAMKLSREEVYIANIVKCRPPGNRNPVPEEVDTCLPYLIEQINLIKPKIMVLLGAVALKSLFKNKNLSITKLRGKYIDWNGIKVMPTFHPAYLLRNPYDKKYVWADMQKVMGDLGIKL